MFQVIAYFQLIFLFYWGDDLIVTNIVLLLLLLLQDIILSLRTHIVPLIVVLLKIAS